MRQDEYDAWLAVSVGRYGREKVLTGVVAAGDADEWAAGQHARLLPDGLRTAGHHLLVAEDDERVGMLWLLVPEGERPRAFVYDLEVEPARRGRGLGREVMRAAEQYALEHGAATIALHVFGHNHVARSLYDGLGYRVTDLTMAKPLG